MNGWKLIQLVQRLDGWAWMGPEERGRSVKLSGRLSNPLSDNPSHPQMEEIFSFINIQIKLVYGWIANGRWHPKRSRDITLRSVRDQLENTHSTQIEHSENTPRAHSGPYLIQTKIPKARNTCYRYFWLTTIKYKVKK